MTKFDWEESHDADGHDCRGLWTTYDDTGTKFTVKLKYRKMVIHLHGKHFNSKDVDSADDFFDKYDQYVNETIPILQVPDLGPDGKPDYSTVAPSPTELYDPVWNPEIGAWQYDTDTPAWTFFYWEDYGILRTDPQSPLYHRKSEVVADNVNTFDQVEILVESVWNQAW